MEKVSEKDLIIIWGLFLFFFFKFKASISTTMEISLKEIGKME